MGHEIVYCIQCRTRLSGVDFEKGRAYRLGYKISCKSCAPQVLATLPQPEQAAFLNGIRERESGARTEGTFLASEPPSPRPVETPASTRRLQPPAPATKRLGWVLLVGALGIVAVGSYILATLTARQPEGRQDVPPPAASPARLPDAPEEDARTRVAGLALKKAWQFRKSNPADLEGQIAAYAETIRLCENTPHLREAKETHQALLELRRSALSEEFSAVEAQARALLAAEEFGAAIALWAEARRRPALADRVAVIDQRIAESRKTAEALLSSLKESALLARQKGREDESRKIRDRVGHWGLQDLSADLDRHLAAPVVAEVPAAKPSSAEAQEYLSRWRDALPLAGAREFEAAIAKLRSAAERITEADVRAEASADIEDLGQVLSLHREACRILSEWPRDKPLTLEWRTEAGERRQMTGRAIRTGPFRTEIISVQGGESVFVEFSDVTAPALGELLKGRREEVPPVEARSVVLFCLLEGELEAAQATLLGPSRATPEKYWAYAREVRGKGSVPSAKEVEARKLFYQADREFPQVRTLGPAVEKYRKLLSDYSDTRLVKGDLEFITGRAGAGREYFLWAVDLRGRGSFRFTRREKGEPGWTSASDGDRSSITENYVEFEFYALPDVPYKCWAYLGACCTETFTFHYQASDLKGPNPGNPKQTVAAEPGGGPALLLKPQIGGLKVRHAAHGGPKEPTRWEWVAVPLPKFSSPGPKSVRLMTDQQGFSVAYVWVSAVRQTPPSKQDVEKELKKGPRTNVVAEEGLVGYWKFDDGKGTAASDSTIHGSTGVLVNAAAWVGGCPATGFANPYALGFDGKAACVKVENDPLFNTLRGQFTFAAWVYPNAIREDWQTILARQLGTSNQHLFILRLDSRNILDLRVVTTQGPATALGGPIIPNRQWTHLACAFDGSAMKLYIDGAEATSVPVGGTLPEERNPLTIGAAEFDANDGLGCPFDGRIDDVRVYARALSAAQIQALAARTAK